MQNVLSSSSSSSSSSTLITPNHLLSKGFGKILPAVDSGFSMEADTLGIR